MEELIAAVQRMRYRNQRVWARRFADECRIFETGFIRVRPRGGLDRWQQRFKAPTPTPSPLLPSFRRPKTDFASTHAKAETGQAK